MSRLNDTNSAIVSFFCVQPPEVQMTENVRGKRCESVMIYLGNEQDMADAERQPYDRIGEVLAAANNAENHEQEG